MSNGIQQSLVDLANLWLKDCHSRNLSLNTIERAYAVVLRDFLNWIEPDASGSLLLSMDSGRRVVTVGASVDILATEITIDHLRDFVLHLQGSTHYERGDHPWMDGSSKEISPATVHRYVRTLKTFFRWCVVEEWLTADPTEKLKNPKLPNRGRRAEVFTEDEIMVLLDVAKRQSFRNYAIVLFMLDTLVRRKELIELTLDDVNLGTGLITIRSGKGQKTRFLRAGQHCQRVLRRYVRDHRRSNNDAFFVSRSGRLTNNALGSVFRRLTIATQMRVYAHKLRHTGATLMAMQGENAPRIADRLGHESLEMANWYIHLAGMKAAQEEASPIDKLLSSTQ